MHCDEFVELVTAYLEDALDPKDRERVHAHLSLCEGCGTYLEQFRTTIELLDQLPTSSIDPAFRDALVASFRASEQKDPGSA